MSSGGKKFIRLAWVYARVNIVVNIEVSVDFSSSGSQASRKYENDEKKKNKKIEGTETSSSGCLATFHFVCDCTRF